MRTIYLILLLSFCFSPLSYAQEALKGFPFRGVTISEALALRDMAILYNLKPEDVPKYNYDALKLLLSAGLDREAVERWENLPDQLKRDPSSYRLGVGDPLVIILNDDLPEGIAYFEYANHEVLIDLAVAYTSIGKVNKGLELIQQASKIGSHELKPGEHCKYDAVRELLMPSLKKNEILDFFIFVPNSRGHHFSGGAPGRLGCIFGENVSLQEIAISYFRKRGFHTLSNLGITGNNNLRELALFKPPLTYKPSKQHEEELRGLAQAYQTKIDDRTKSFPTRDERQRFKAFLPNKIDVQRMVNPDVEEHPLSGLRRWRYPNVEAEQPLLVPNAFVLFDTKYRETLPSGADALQVFEDAENERLYIWKQEFDSTQMWHIEKTSNGYLVTEVYNEATAQE